MAVMEETRDANICTAPLACETMGLSVTHPAQRAIAASIIQHANFLAMGNSEGVHLVLYEFHELGAHPCIDRTVREPV